MADSKTIPSPSMRYARNTNSKDPRIRVLWMKAICGLRNQAGQIRNSHHATVPSF